MYNFLSTKIDLSNNRFTKQNRQNVNSIVDSTRMLHISLENNQKQAINAYDYFMNELNKSGTYIDDSSEFNAIADEYYSKKNNTEIGHLLIGMIDKQGTPFWSFSNHLCLNCGGYDSFGRAFGYQALFGEKFEEKEVQSLLKDLPLLLKLQFIITVEKFWKVYSYEFTVMKSLRINRFLGNLVWILEATPLRIY